MTAYRGDQAQRAAADEEELDFYPTPPWAARACAEKILQLDPAARTCWEPACGEGHMLHGLQDYFDLVAGSDIHPYGAGAVFDFLGDPPHAFAKARWDWICTNPPFKDAEAFLRAAMPRARRGVALLLRLQFICGQERHNLLFGKDPVTVIAPFAERVPMRKGYWDPKGSTATDYCLFIWQKMVPPGPRIEPIPPGQRARLSRDSDVARFGPMGVDVEAAA
jgi:hypothetical protein